MVTWLEEQLTSLKTEKNKRNIKLIFAVFTVVALLALGVTTPILGDKEANDEVKETTREYESCVTESSTTTNTISTNANATSEKTETSFITITTKTSTTTTGTTTTTAQDPVNPCPFECTRPEKCTEIVGETPVEPKRNSSFGTINATKQFKINVGIDFPNYASEFQTNAVHVRVF